MSSPLRPSLAAIAAALALSATPAFAQADPAAAPAAAPVTIAPPAPSVAPAASEASAADQTSNMSAVVDDTPATSVATRSPVVVHTTPDSGAAAPSTARAPVSHIAAKFVAAPVATPAPTPAPVVKTAEPAPAPAPVLREPPPAASTAQTQTKVSSTTQTDDTALYAGLGGAAILLLGGGAFALSRRKRDEEMAYETPAYESDFVAVPAVAAEPSYVAASAVAPVATDEPALANGFDLSRFGPHTRAAYRGPTEDNPSLSLKKRLKVASFLDGRLRESGEQAEDIADPWIDRREARADRKIFGGKLADRLAFRPGPRSSFRPATA